MKETSSILPFLDPGWLAAIDRNRIYAREGSYRDPAQAIRVRSLGLVKLGTFGSKFNDWNLAYATTKEELLAIVDALDSQKCAFFRAPNIDEENCEGLSAFLKDRGWRVDSKKIDVSPRIERENGSLLARTSPQLLKDCEKKMKKFKSRFGEPRFSFQSTMADSDFDFLARNHVARREDKNQKSIFAKENYRHFLKEAFTSLEKSGQLRLAQLRAEDGKSCAQLFGMVWNGVYFYYLPVFDSAYHQASPGKLLLKWVLEEALSKDIWCADLLIGNEAYKYEWGAVDRPILNLRAMRFPFFPRGKAK